MENQLDMSLDEKSSHNFTALAVSGNSRHLSRKVALAMMSTLVDVRTPIKIEQGMLKSSYHRTKEPLGYSHGMVTTW